LWNARYADIVRELSQPANAQMKNILDDFSDEVIANAISAMLKPEYGWDSSSIMPRKPPPPPPPGGGSPGWKYLAAAGATVPYLLMQSNERELKGWLEAMNDPKKAAAENMGYRWCFISQDYRPFPETNPDYSDNPFFLFLHETGLNVIRGFELSNPDYRAVLRSLSKTSFMHNGQQVNYVERTEQASGIIERKVVQFVFNGELRNQELLIYQAGMIKNFEVLGFILHQQTNTSNIVELGVAFTYQALNDVRIYRLVLTGIKFDRNEMPTQSPTGTVNLAPTNSLTSLDDVMEEIRRLAHHPARENDEVIIMMPLLQPEFFPEIPPEHFPEFAREFLEQLRREDIIMPGHEAIEITINIPELPQPPTLPNNPPTDLTGITGLLQRILNTITGIPSAIAKAIEPILPTKTTLEDDLPMLYMPEDMDFDFRIYLMDYFPFSLPRDFYDIVNILFGTSSAGLAGATTYERALFDHYNETGYMSEQGYEILEPMFIGTHFTPPRFEIDIPLPDFSSGRIDNDNSQIAYTFVFDMGEYPTLIAIIRASVFVIVLIGLIKLTPSVITW
jgi:hypothetical protein